MKEKSFKIVAKNLDGTEWNFHTDLTRDQAYEIANILNWEWESPDGEYVWYLSIEEM